MQTFEEAKVFIVDKKYDYLDQKNTEFDTDYDAFIQQTDKLKTNISAIIEKNYTSVWETPQGIRFLERFEKVYLFVNVYFCRSINIGIF